MRNEDVSPVFAVFCVASGALTMVPVSITDADVGIMVVIISSIISSLF